MKRLAILLGGLLLAAANATGFAIGGAPFQQAEILDARAMPEIDGSTSILLTFDPKAAPRLEKLSAANIGKPLAVTLDGRTIASPTVAEPITTGTLTLTGSFTLPEAEALAKRISGKDPVPEEFED
ncbi:SecDF P1 head subdomain-containing protein [Sphingomonas fennica]|uniref:SecDF P1 head subdomain domain-containing protein n=1 Tax=Edaphosphingomonas fennica TaxID=114404 RepID=A0A2T4I692_9SPHN|nr:hypothetical protein [Sphingomonas fennica]PTD26139.1 hypothetical protein CV103_03815 [Sphingomonas fennica]